MGKNMTVYEYGGEIIVVDCGMAFPGDDMYGIDCVILPRKEALGKAISASTVRAALQAGDWQTLSQLVPQTTLDYFRSSEAEPVLRRIRSAENVVHY